MEPMILADLMADAEEGSPLNLMDQEGDVFDSPQLLGWRNSFLGFRGIKQNEAETLSPHGGDYQWNKEFHGKRGTQLGEGIYLADTFDAAKGWSEGWVLSISYRGYSQLRGKQLRMSEGPRISATNGGDSVASDGGFLRAPLSGHLMQTVIHPNVTNLYYEVMVSDQESPLNAFPSGTVLLFGDSGLPI